MSTIEALTEANPDALLADGLEPALVGYTVNHHRPHVAVYDIDKYVKPTMPKGGEIKVYTSEEWAAIFGTGEESVV